MNIVLSKYKLIYLLLVLIIIVHIFIFTKLIYFPYPELFIYPYLTNHGLKPYSQILDQHFPGLLFLPINFDNLGMNTPEVARLWSIAIVFIIHIMLFIVSSKILKSTTKAILVNILYLVWQPFFEGWVLWIDNFLPLLLLPAFYALYKEKIFVSGILLGLSIVFKQTMVPLAILLLVYLFLSTQNFRVVFSFLSGIFFPIVLMVAYFVNMGVARDLFYWTIIFNLTTYAKYGTKVSPSIGFISRILLVYAASIPALLDKNKRLVHILFIFLAGSMVGIFERADFVHLQPSLPFVCLASVVSFSVIWKKKIARLLILGYFVVMIWWLNIFYKGHLSNKVLLFDSQTLTIASKIRSYTYPGEKIFIFGSPPHLYQMSNTLPAGDVFVFQFPWFLKVSEQRILEGIKKDKPKTIVSDRTIIIEGARIVDFASDIDQYIKDNYQKIDNVGTVDILQKKSSN